MTKRLYYEDPYLLDFEAEVLNRFNPGAGRQHVILDKTAFYPTSGGQPHDTGVLEDQRVLTCFEDESGNVVHEVEGAVVGKRVRGFVDRDRRIDHIQQHSGQHVLSRACLELFGWPTIGFHMGNAVSTIDIGVESVSKQQIKSIEELANRVILSDFLVTMTYVKDHDSSGLDLRKPSKRKGRIRVVDIHGFDRSACGGTHVTATGQIGPILVSGTERVRKQVRLEFLCGYRALDELGNSHKVLKGISKITSVPALRSLSVVQSMKDELLVKKKVIEELQQKITEYEALSFPIKDGLAVALYETRTPEEVRELARMICKKRSATVVFATRTEPVNLIVASSQDQSVDAGELLEKVLTEFGGKGGGGSTFAQGGVPDLEDPSVLLEFARKQADKDFPVI